MPLPQIAVVYLEGYQTCYAQNHFESLNTFILVSRRNLESPIGTTKGAVFYSLIKYSWLYNEQKVLSL